MQPLSTRDQVGGRLRPALAQEAPNTLKVSSLEFGGVRFHQ